MVVGRTVTFLNGNKQHKAHTDANIAGSVSPADDTDAFLVTDLGARTIRKHRGAANGPNYAIWSSQIDFWGRNAVCLKSPQIIRLLRQSPQRLNDPTAQRPNDPTTQRRLCLKNRFCLKKQKDRCKPRSLARYCSGHFSP
jgi:hypothetical protein